MTIISIANAYAAIKADYARFDSDEAAWTHEEDSLRLVALAAAAAATVRMIVVECIGQDGVSAEDENGRWTVSLDDCVAMVEADAVRYADSLSQMILDIFAREGDRAERVAMIAVKGVVAPAALAARPHSVL